MTDEPELFGEEEGAPSAFSAAARDAGERRGVKGPGRPKGAINKKTADFEKWYFAKGFKDPAQVLGELATMDPLQLHALLIEKAAAQGVAPKSWPSLADAVKLIAGAAGELMPYLHGKKPTQIEIMDERLPALFIELGTNQLEQLRQAREQKALSIGAPLDVEKPQKSGLSEDEE